MGSLEIIPRVVHDLKGEPVRLSAEARHALADLITSHAAYIYQAGIDRKFWNVWLNHEIDPKTGYRGVRIPLADWALAFDARQEARA